MKSFVLYFALLLSVSLLVARIAPAQQDIDHKADLLVDDDKVQCPTATFSSIQDAINAANPGNLIRVCAGTYGEQLFINKSLSIEADNGAILLPTNMVANTTGATGAPIAAAIVVKDSVNVEIEGLIVDAANNGVTECAPDLIGILYQNSSGIIEHNAIRNTKLSTALNGCQSGTAIVVESLASKSSTVRINDNSVHDYQKNGITSSEAGTETVIVDNVVTGLGPTTGAAQNGIQVGFGAKGRVVNNTVTDNVWSPCTSLMSCTANATGILIFQSDDVRVEKNNVATNQVGIYANGTGDRVESNNVASTLVLAGIDLAGSGGVANHNKVTNSGQAAILIEGDDNSMVGNELTEAPVGILKLSGTVGNTHSGNSFYATLVTVQDPGPVHNIRVVPDR